MNYRKKSGRKKSIVLLVIISLLIAISSVLTIVPYEMDIRDYVPVIKNISLGIDLKGGVYVVMESKYPNDEDGNPVSQAEYEDSLSGTIKILETRLIGKGFTEATVVMQGTDRIRIEIPDVDNPDEIFDIIGKPAVLEFRDPDGNVLLTGSKHLKSAYATYDQDSAGYAVGLKFNDEGTKLFADATSKLQGKVISIYVDDKEVSAPTVNTVISNGQAIITGMGSTPETAQNLAMQLQSGALPLELIEIQSGNISPTLGQDALRGGIIAGLIGLALIIIFMCIYYRGLGLASSIALVIYTLLMLFVLAGAPMFFSLKIFPSVQLTLPGIAGIILSIGMAVDANVIIFERIRDEYRIGKSIETSVKIGFKRAFWAIFDSNVTTMFAGLVLLLLGTGSIKGFAIVLIIGIILSVFTALIVTRFLLKLFLSISSTNAKFYGLKKEEEIVPRGVFKKQFRIVENKKKFITASSTVIIAGILVAVIFGLNLGIDFTGGTIMDITIGTQLSNTGADANFDDFTAVIDKTIKDYGTEKGINFDLGTPQLTGAKSDKAVTIRFNYKNNFTDQEISDHNDALKQLIRDNVGEKMAQLNILDTNLRINTESVGATISNELVFSAFWSVALAAVLMLIYLAFRFELLMGAASVIALLHDVLIMFAFVSIFRFQINSTFVAAMITIVGYSINATIVIFDRVRENLKRLSLREASYSEIANKSIKESLMRSINTSITTLFTIIMLYIIGVPSVKEFAFPIIIGLLAGTYSSLFLATPLWVLFKTTHDKNKAKRAAAKAANASKAKAANA